MASAVGTVHIEEDNHDTGNPEPYTGGREVGGTGSGLLLGWTVALQDGGKDPAADRLFCNLVNFGLSINVPASAGGGV